MTKEGMSGLAVHSIKREAGTGGPVPGHGIPVVATASRFTAPVHIDVGGQIYTSSLDTLTRWEFFYIWSKFANNNANIRKLKMVKHYTGGFRSLSAQTSWGSFLF